MHMRRLILVAGLVMATAAPVLAAGNEEPDRLARWAALSAYLFGEETDITPTETVVTLDAPTRAHDSALVPVSIAAEAGVTGLSLIIDDNPGPVAAQIEFGPAGDARELGLRVRVNGYTNMHAVATTADGGMVENAVFVKGAGGCSAPVGVSDLEAMAGMGDMRMRFGESELGGAGQATLMVRHPNFTGMQMNQLTRLYTPPRYITAIQVDQGDELVFTMASDISLSADPVIEFLYRKGSAAPFRVMVTDSEGASWTQEFASPEMTN